MISRISRMIANAFGVGVAAAVSEVSNAGTPHAALAAMPAAAGKHRFAAATRASVGHT
jgi:hypothetical protein